MAEISRATLFGKLNPLMFKAAEGAVTFCKLRGNPHVDLTHWLFQIVNLPDSDLHRILRHFEVDTARLVRDFQTMLERLPRGASAIEDFSEHLPYAVKEGWMYATLLFGESQVRSGYLLVGLLKNDRLRNVLTRISGEFEKVKVETLTEDFARIVKGSPEDGQVASDGFAPGTPGEASNAIPPAAMGKQEALRRFASDLTARARAGGIDPVTGRDEEIRQVVDILMRRRQNNPILTGEAGVGKTAVAEGFALRIANGDVPPSLKDVQLWVLDIGLLQAGASMKGEFENRLRSVIDEVQASAKPIILFIDEAHTLIGAGGAAGTGDAANLLKPALARGTLRTIAATTWAEYKKYIEKDPALTRRFQVVQVLEPTESKALLMLRGVASTLEKHHRVQLLDEALDAAVKLSHRYIPARQLPDKAVSLLDTTCARVAVSQHATPPEVEDSRRRIEALQTELDIIGREEATGFAVGSRRTDAEGLLATEKDRLAGLEQRWTEERNLVDRILELRRQLRDETEAKEPAAREARLTELRELQSTLAKAQGDAPLILPSVDGQAVAAVVSDWTGIPVGRMVKNEVEAVLKLVDTLATRVVGQRHGLEMIARRIQTSRARLDNPEKPIGVFLLVGPSGVGKTETALALAESLYGGQENVITINMSEFQEAHTVSTLKGAPPGYVGYERGGVLTEAVRRRPYSVVLLDEVEKAHPDVHEIFFQVFDKGFMEDSDGRYIDFKNTVILLTSNTGTDRMMALCKDPDLRPEPQALARAVREPLLKVFPPALLGRLVVIPYYPLPDTILGDIVRLQLDRIARRIGEQHKVPFVYDDAVVKLVVSRCTEVESGGRMIDAILTNTILPRISEEYLARMVAGRPLGAITLGVRNGDFSFDLA
ncbi:MAG: type VI secretion system ATPase TssH [Candidatus Rokuibacteriota bacterium]|nr:MAG: type VI secretion system ATPase TssH [Candidatus Rokubacteria bacterium]